MSILFNPNSKIVMETEYFLVRNEIFDLTFKVMSLKRFKEGKTFAKDKYVVEYRELDTYEIATYIYLCRASNNKDNAFPSYTTIANKVKCSRSKAQECIEVLFQNGFIYKENRKNDKGEYTSNIYVVNTDLPTLKNKLDNMYADKDTTVITQKEKDCISSIPSDNIPIPSDNIPSIPSDNTPIPSDGKKKEQHKKNNIIKKEQYNNNKESVVVDEQYLNAIKNLISKLSIKLTDTDINLIINDIKKFENEFSIETLEKRFEAIKNYINKNDVKNVVGLIRRAIKEKWVMNYNNKPKKDNFNNYEQREYDFNELERKLLGWD